MTLFEGLVYKTGYVQLLDLFYFKIGAVFPLIFIVFLSFEWAGRSNMYAIEKLFIKKKRIFRRIVYYVIILIVMYYSASDVEQEFIYFNF